LRRLYESAKSNRSGPRFETHRAGGAMIAAFDSPRRAACRARTTTSRLRDAAQRLTKTPRRDERSASSTRRCRSRPCATSRHLRRLHRSAQRRFRTTRQGAASTGDGHPRDRRFAERCALAQLDRRSCSLRASAMRVPLSRVAARTDLAPIPKPPKLNRRYRSGHSFPAGAPRRAQDLPAAALAPAPSTSSLRRGARRSRETLQDRNGLAADAVIGAGTPQASRCRRRSRRASSWRWSGCAGSPTNGRCASSSSTFPSSLRAYRQRRRPRWR
jgi:hypothetical protein